MENKNTNNVDSKNDSINKEELMNLDKKELIEKIIQLKAHNVQLKNIIAKNIEDNKGILKKPFDFDNANFRRVLLRLMYFGWDYQGLAVQEDTNNTIEHYVFKALTKSCLIKSRVTSQYHRCGRTDKGVSSFGQVISIYLRSKFPTDQQNTSESISKEMPYCKILNRLLPDNIRAIAWMAIPPHRPDYSARFDCKSRMYKYYFPRASLDLAAMTDACSRLIGPHDFRHLCKMDVGNGVTEFRREIRTAAILPVDIQDTENATSMYYLSIEGNAFLWHQIRCIMGLLFLVGQGKESPTILTELLDVEKVQRKPQYNMALDVPLNLFRCNYDLEKESKWIYDRDELQCLVSHLQSIWTIYNIKTTMIKECMEYLEKTHRELSKEADDSEKQDILSYANCLLQGVKSRVYKPLMERQTCSSLEERIEYYRKRRKLDEGKKKN